VTASPDRPLPHSRDSERALLGAIILGAPIPDSIDFADFYVPEFSTVFRTMKDAHADGRDASDPVVLFELLADNSQIMGIGGAAFISSLSEGLPRTSNVNIYAEVIKTKSEVRRKLYLAESIRDKLAGVNGNATQVLREIAALSAPLTVEVAQKGILTFKTGAQIASMGDEKIPWIVPGYVAKGVLTELGAKIKTGKTTLILLLVRAVLDGLSFLGQPTFKTRVVYLTEQPSVSFYEALKRADLLGREDLIVLSFSDTRGLEWPQVAAAAVAECKRIDATLLIIDTLPQFAGLTGDKENNSGDALNAMQPLQKAASEGIGVTLVRHERKAGGDVGDSGRGSSAFAGAVDIVLSLRKSEGNSPKNRRLLQSLSRFSETPADLLIELTDSGYIALGEPADAAVKDAKDSISAIAPKTELEALDLGELSKAADISRRTAQRAVDELLKEMVLSRIGKGKKGNPFRYFSISEMPFCATSNIEEQKNRISECDLWTDHDSGEYPT
jgi:hypothetical protein